LLEKLAKIKVTVSIHELKYISTWFDGY